MDLRAAPDLPPHISIDDLSVQELKSKVVDATLNALAWMKRHSLKLSLKSELELDAEQKDYPVAVKVVPGGKMILVVNNGQLEVWSVESKMCLWSARTVVREDDLECTSFDFDLQKTPDGLNLMIVAEYSSSFAAIT